MTSKKSKKVKAKTLIQRMGFKDKDIKTSDHDNIVLWLYQEDVLLDILKKCFDKQINRLKEIKIEQINASKRISAILDRVTEDIAEIKKIELFIHIHRKEIEHIVTNEKGYDIGFIDLAVFFDVNQFKKIIKNRSPSWTAYFEVKSQYPTLGELLRQLNIYKKYLHTTTMENVGILSSLIIVGPENKKIPNFPRILEEQGFNFIECPAELIISNISNSKIKQKTLF